NRGAAGALATIVPQVVWEYFLFYSLLCLACLTWSIVRLRALALKQSYGKVAKVRWWQQFRAPVGDLPVLWKEVNIEGSLRFNWVGWLFVLLLILFTVGIGVWIVVYHFWEVFF